MTPAKIFWTSPQACSGPCSPPHLIWNGCTTGESQEGMCHMLISKMEWSNGETGTSCRGFTLFVVSSTVVLQWLATEIKSSCMKQFLDSQRTTWEIHDSFRSFCILGLFSSTILPDCILYHRCMCLHLLLNPRDTAVPWLN